MRGVPSGHALRTPSVARQAPFRPRQAQEGPGQGRLGDVRAVPSGGAPRAPSVARQAPFRARQAQERPGQDRLGHIVGRVLSFSPVVGIGTPSTPHPQASVPPLLGSGGRGTLAGERGGFGESHFRRGGIHCGTLFYIYALCGVGAVIYPMFTITVIKCSNTYVYTVGPSDFPR